MNGWWFIIPAVFSGASLIVVVVVIIRKFPQAALLDVNHLPEEWQAQRKKEILARRMAEEGKEQLEKLSRRLSPLKRLWAKTQFFFRVYVGRVNRMWAEERSRELGDGPVALRALERKRKVAELVKEAYEHMRVEKYDLAEGLFIAAIKIDPRNVEAYRGLGETYVAKQSFAEARETFRFLLKLTPDDDAVMVRLATIAEEQGELDEAIGYYQQALVVNDTQAARFFHLAELLLRVKQPIVAKEALLSAVELEARNPKYLDLLTEAAILCKDKELSERALKELRLVNPDNQKLDVFKSRIADLDRS